MESVVKNIKLSKLLFDSGVLLKKIQKDVKTDFLDFGFKDDLIFEFDSMGYSEFLKKNFFTLLMLSILIKLGVSHEELKSHGKIILYLRQIITSVDNIIDNEEKGVIKFKTLKNIVVKNSLLTLIIQDMMTKECLKLTKGEPELSNKILEELHIIATSEALRDRELYMEYPTSQYIYEKIHRGIGGKLLEISLFPYKYLMNNYKNEIEVKQKENGEKYLKGLYKIGMSLQGLDDFFDMEEDKENNKINSAHGEYLELIKTNGKNNLEKIGNEFAKDYLNSMIKKSYDGFQLLESAGYPINKNDAKELLKKLFKLRGLGEYVYLV